MNRIFKVYYFLTATCVALTLISCNDGSSAKSEDKLPITKPKLVTEVYKEGLDDRTETIKNLDLSEGKAQGIETMTCLDISDLGEALIAKHSNDRWGKEYCRFRSIASSQAIEVVLFTLEGQCWKKKDKPKGSCGNNYSRYMIGILNGKPLGPIQVDNSSSFSAQTVAVSGKEIVVSGAFHQSGDGKCCPSKKGKRLFSYNSQGFEEINPNTDDNYK